MSEFGYCYVDNRSVCRLIVWVGWRTPPLTGSGSNCKIGWDTHWSSAVKGGGGWPTCAAYFAAASIFSFENTVLPRWRLSPMGIRLAYGSRP